MLTSRRISHVEFAEFAVDLEKILEKLWLRYGLKGNVAVIRKLENEIKLKRTDSSVFVSKNYCCIYS